MSMRPLVRVLLVSLALVATSCSPSKGSATSSTADATGDGELSSTAASWHEFTAVQGKKEFSGRLVARPLQPESAAAAGLSEQALAQRQAQARADVAQYRIESHVNQIDEYLFQVPGGSDENTIAQKLMATGNFEYVEPDWEVYPIGCPNDTLFANQWNHAPDRMQSCDAWALHTGTPTVSIGFCDTGILTTHEDLALHRLEGYNAVDQLWESQGGDISPVHYHGTCVTGCAAANGDNGKGIAGVGWNLGHRMLRVSNLSTGSASLSVLRHAAMTAIESGNRVASVSYSGVDSLSNLATATYIKSIGGLLVWAAGNDNRNLTSGNRDADDIIVAGATDSSDLKASFSAYGPFVDLVAPGVSVLSTYTASNSSYAYVSGTSFACPLVAGVCAMIWSANPALTPDQVEAILKQGCDDLGAAGVDDTFGHGRVNLYNAVLLAQGGAPAPPPPSAPTAQFSGTPLSGTAPLLVAFSDESSGEPVSWSWDFGDGSAGSTAQNPSHTYTEPGTYTVKLTVTNANGSDAEVKSGYVTVEPAGAAGEGFILSKNPDFSTDDRTFSRSDTIYIKVWSDNVDHTKMRSAKWELKSGKNRVRGNLTTQSDGTHTASFDLGSLPSNATSWNFKAEIQDRQRNAYRPQTTITVN